MNLALAAALICKHSVKPLSVIAAQAAIQTARFRPTRFRGQYSACTGVWTPAFAGVTKRWVHRMFIALALAFLLNPPVFAAPSNFCPEPIGPPVNALAPGSSKKPFNALKPPLSKGVGSLLESLCWKVDGETGLVEGPRKTLLTEGQMKAFLSDYNVKENPLTDEERGDLYEVGCRFDSSNHILYRKDHAKPRTLSNLSVLVFQRKRMLGLSQRLAGRIEGVLAKQDPHKPLSPKALKEIEQMSFNTVGSRSLPPALKELIQLRSGNSVGDIERELTRAQADFSRMFDGKESPRELSRTLVQLNHLNQFPKIHTGEWRSQVSDFYFNKSESRLGREAQKQIQAVLSQNPVGVEILNRFRDNSGKIKLPGFAVGDLQGFDWAVSVPGKNLLIFNIKSVLKDPTLRPFEKSADPPPQDSISLARWFLRHPQAMKSFVKNNDFVIAHELTHLANDREIPRGYNPADVLEDEHEAFTAETRYALAQIELHPRSSLANPNYQEELSWRIRPMLVNYGKFLQGIDYGYLNGNSVAAMHFEDAAQLVERERLDKEKRLGRETPDEIKKSLLKIFGLQETQEAEDRFGKVYEEKTKKFIAGDYLKMRADARKNFPKIAEKFLVKAHQERNWGRYYYNIQNAMNLAVIARDLGVSAENSFIARLQEKSAAQALRTFAFSRRGKRSSRDFYLRISYAFAALSKNQKIENQARAAAVDSIKASLRSKRYLKSAEALAREIGDQSLLEQVREAIRDA